MAKASRPVIYGALAVVVVASLIFLNGGDQPSTSKRGKTTVGKSSKEKGVEFTEEDYTATFQPVNATARNVFRPIVARASISGLGASGPSGVPTELTLGEQNWVYTGMAEVDNVPTALLENTSTQDGVFLKQGERWKQATVYQITPDTLTLVGQDGTHHYVKVVGSEEPSAEMPAVVRPLAVNPPSNLSGPIGTTSVGPTIDIQPVRGSGRNPGVTNVR